MNRQDKEEGNRLNKKIDFNYSEPEEKQIENRMPEALPHFNSDIYIHAIQILRSKFPRSGGTIESNTRTTEDQIHKKIEIKTEIEKPSRSDYIDEYIPARMINEFVYCPRLFYYEFVEGIFLDNADTLRGSAIHSRVDRDDGEMPVSSNAIQDTTSEFGQKQNNQINEEQQNIRSRSVTLSSDNLKIVAKIDLVEINSTIKDGIQKFVVCPVDYKAGKSKKQDDGIEMWAPDKIQLALQCLLLRENGYECNEGIIYYSSTKQKVHLPITEDLIKWVLEQVQKAREVAVGEIPPPLSGSGKCVRCSLAPICLPDETNFLKDCAISEQQKNRINSILDAKSTPLKNGSIYPREEIRRLISPRDDTRALYLTTQGLKLGKRDEMLEIKEEQKLIETVRLKDISHVALFGNIQITTQAIQSLCHAEIPITYFSTGGWFYGITRGHTMKNVFLRIKQVLTAEKEEECVKIARKMIFAKIRNQRTMLMRNHIEPPTDVIKKLKILSDETLKITKIEELLGLEGIAANLYFENFSGLIKVNDEISSAVEENEASENRYMNEDSQQMTFDFTSRNRRPPRDPVNALLSLAYSLLAKDCMIATLSVGFDPYIGFYHRPRFGRPALALDIMEEFRPLIAESVVITAINNRVITLKDFVRAGKSVNLTAGGRKKFFYIYEQRINTVVTHPLFDYKVTYRRAIELQTRILARTLTGEITNYVPFITR